MLEALIRLHKDMPQKKDKNANSNPVTVFLNNLYETTAHQYYNTIIYIISTRDFR
jgi:hypothetical protein